MRIILILSMLFFIAETATSQWVQKNNSPVTARHHPVTFTVGGDAYLLSGTTAQSNPEGTDNFYRYEPIEDTWVELDNFPGGARSFAYAGTYNDKAYFGFGTNNFVSYFNDLWEFDPVLQQWTELSSCPCIGRTHPAFVVHQGKIFVGLGGNNGDLGDWWEYDIETDSWTQRPSLPGPPRHHPFHFAAGDHVYAGFGHSGSNFFADWYRYDPSNNSWTQMNNHPGGPRVAGQEFDFNGYGYVISGDGDNHQNLQEGEFWKYDHNDDTWTQLPSHPGTAPDGRIGRWAPGSFVLDGHVYFFGGVNRGGSFLYADMWSYELEPTTVSAAEVKASQVAVYPNPVSEQLNFSLDVPEDAKLAITIHNTLGEMVKTETTRNRWVSTATLPDGLYFLTIQTSDNQQFATKFVVRN